MGWGRRIADSDKVRENLIERAGLELTGVKTNDRTFLVALFLEQVRTNELLEEMLSRQSEPTRSAL